MRLATPRPRHVLNLSAVCQSWRDALAALSKPMWWSTLELSHHKTKSNMDNHIDSWIKRAHSYPLSLIIIYHDGFLDPVNNFFTNHKWKSITLKMILYLGGTLASHSQTNKISVLFLFVFPVIDDS